MQSLPSLNQRGNYRRYDTCDGVVWGQSCTRGQHSAVDDVRLRYLPEALDLRRCKKLRRDFQTPVRALVAASGVVRRPVRLMTRTGATMIVDRGDAPLWREYFHPNVCFVEIKDGLFHVLPRDLGTTPYYVAGGRNCLTHKPQRWNREAYRSPLVSQLEGAEHGVYSQHGEDGVIGELLRSIGPTHRFIVEFGAYDGIAMSNSRNLIVHANWSALLIEGNRRFFRSLSKLYRHHPTVTTLNAFVTTENINTLFHDAGVPREFDLLSIDVDSIDYYLWQALTEFRPNIVLIEYNASIPPDENYVVPKSDALRLSGTSREGASIQALYRLGKDKGYRMVYSELTGANLFFVRDDLCDALNAPELSPEALYQPPQFGLLGGGSAPNGRGYR